MCEPLYATHKIERKCFYCGETTNFIMSPEQYELYVIKHEFVQDVFPNTPAPIREIMISGTHPDCWDELFGSDDE